MTYETTTNLADFGYREIKMARDLLDSWINNGLPDDFDNSGVVLMMNRNSGNVFLTNEEFEVAMLTVDGTLESYYNSPYECREGFFEDLLAEYKDMHKEDKEWFRDLAETINRADELPKDVPEEKCYFYYINVDERGEFSADVRDTDDNTVFEIEGFSIFEDGYMSDKEDIEGLKGHISRLGILPDGYDIVKGN